MHQTPHMTRIHHSLLAAGRTTTRSGARRRAQAYQDARAHHGTHRYQRAGGTPCQVWLTLTPETNGLLEIELFTRYELAQAGSRSGARTRLDPRMVPLTSENADSTVCAMPGHPAPYDARR
jgi:hypothetical protein